MTEKEKTARSDPEKVAILLTSAYPCGGLAERTFIEPELEPLLAAFECVYVVPGKAGGSQCPVPEGVAVDESYARSRQGWKGVLRFAWLSLGSGLFWRDLARRPVTVFQPRALARLVLTVGTARLLCAWLDGLVTREDIEPAATVLYSYWLGPTTLAACLCKEFDPSFTVISRAHGADVYEHRKTPPYFPCRDRYLRDVDRVFTVSDDGRRHLGQQYPAAKDRLETVRLGVADCGVRTGASRDGVIRVVSCSLIKPVKRLPLLVDGLRALGEAHPDRRIVWHHMGGGAGLNVLRASARSLPDNIMAELDGQVEPAEVLSYYRDHPVDLLINVSRSEGLPVSIMEAICCGIPVAAPAVGGIPEIISAETGMLMSANPSPREIAQAIWTMAADPDVNRPFRDAARKAWEARYDADTNFKHFVKRLQTLISTKG